MADRSVFSTVKDRLHQGKQLIDAVLTASLRRVWKGPRRPGWTWSFELLVEFLQKQFHDVSQIELEDSVTAAREYLDLPPPPLPVLSDVTIDEAAAPVESLWVHPEDPKNDRTILYLHGGGFVHYLESHKILLAYLARELETSLLVPDYRLAPEHPFPAALEDVRASYEWLIDDRDLDPDSLVVMGDSAGGNLTISLLLTLRDAGCPFPALGVGLAPWTDLRNRGESIEGNAVYDYLDKEHADRWARWYAGERSLSNPLISPVEADLEGLPPLYLQAGGSEVIVDMIRTFTRRARAADVDVTLDVWDQMVHVFQPFALLQPEPRRALENIRRTVDDALG